MSDRTSSPDQDQQPELPLDGIAFPPTISPETSAVEGENDPSPPATGDPDPGLGDTVGTGSVVALGCIAGTVFIIVLGLIYIAVTQLLG